VTADIPGPWSSIATPVRGWNANRQAWVWWSIAGGLALWFPLDTARSIYARVHLNAALNVALLVAAAIPLLATFGEFPL